MFFSKVQSTFPMRIIHPLHALTPLTATASGRNRSAMRPVPMMPMRWICHFWARALCWTHFWYAPNVRPCNNLLNCQTRPTQSGFQKYQYDISFISLNFCPADSIIIWSAIQPCTFWMRATKESTTFSFPPGLIIGLCSDTHNDNAHRLGSAAATDSALHGTDQRFHR